MPISRTMRNLGVVLLTASLLEGCASVDAGSGANDPLESTNRAIFAFDRGFDHVIARPVAKGYVAVVPQPVRDGIHNVLSNFFLPVTFANDLLQAQIGRGGQTIARLAINPTLRVGALVYL